MTTTNDMLTDTNVEESSPIAAQAEISIAEQSPKPTKIKLTGRMLNFTRLHITGNDLEKIKAQLDKKFAHQPNSKMPVVLSCDEKLDLVQLLDQLWDLNLQPIGIVTGQMDEQATQQRLAIFPADGKRIDILTDDTPAQKTPTPQKIDPPKADTLPSEKKSNNKADLIKPSETPTILPQTQANETFATAENEQTIEIANTYISSLPQTSQLEGDMVYSTMLRSGQSINHVGGDLILTQGINAGAEAITDYSLHVYGKAEGRLVAGATGDENARIFCLRFNPSLVSVAGTFCLRENIPSEFLEKSVQVSYDRDKGLVFQVMNV